MFRNRIYLDYASLTPIDPRVIREVSTYSSPNYANPSSLYRQGVAAKKVLAEARKKVADFIHALPDEIIFTSGGTEANGLALEGAVRSARLSGIKKPHLIISAIEHASVREVAANMEKQGVNVTYIPVDEYGFISVDEVKKAITPYTYMVSIMTVNNEIGAIQPIRDIAKVIRQARKQFGHTYPLFHTDAAQGALYSELFVEKLGVDLLTLDASKTYGPRGIGCLYVKRGTPIQPIMYGGGQERTLRSGTENIPGIAGFAKALEIADAERDKETKRLDVLKEFFSTELRKVFPTMKINSPEVNNFRSSQGKNKESEQYASPHILNVSIPGMNNELLLFRLDAKGIACSTKSSCLRDEDESYVLKAMGADSSHALRFSFGRWTKKADLVKTIKVLKDLFANNWVI
jgi:cysteine desulfurase